MPVGPLTIRSPLRSLAVAALLVSACSSDDTADLAESGVGVIAEGCPGPATERGSGVALGTSGQVVTVAHTVAGAASVTVVDSTGREHDATVVAFDKDADLALLDAPSLEAPPLQLGSSTTGEATTIVWSVEDGVTAQPASITKPLLITIEDIYLEAEVRRAGLELTGDVESGDSGGAVIDPSGNVVGIIYAKSLARPGTAFATSDVEIRRLIDERPLDATDRCT